MDEIEDLFGPSKAGYGWYDNLSDDEKAWVGQVVEAAKRHGRRPGTAKFCKAFEKQFGHPVAPGTARKHLRLLTGLE